MHAAERSHSRAQSRPGAFARIAMDLAHAISIVVSRPLVVAMSDRGVWQIQSVVTAVLIRIDHRRVVWNGFGQNALTGGLVAVPDHPAAFFARLAADDVDDRWPVVVYCSVSRSLVRPSARRVVRVRMRRTFFSRR